METAFAAVDRKLLDASALLGASRWRTFWRIVLPLGLPGVLTGFVLSFAHTLGEFGVVLMIGGNIPGATRTISILIFDQVEALDYAAANRTALLAAGTLFCACWRCSTACAGEQPGMCGAGNDRLAGVLKNEELSVRIRKRFRRPARDHRFALMWSSWLNAGFTILFGASGAGKTTLLDCIAGLQTPESGRIAFGETVLFDSEAHVNLPPNRRSVGYLLQSLALFPHMTVAENVQYGLAALAKAEREDALPRDSGVVPNWRSGAASPRRDFRWRTSACRAGAGAGDAASSSAARRAAYRARCCDQVADRRRPARLEPRAADSDSLRDASARGGVCAGRERHCVGGRRDRGAAARRTKFCIGRSRRPSPSWRASRTFSTAAVIAAHPEQGTMTCRVGESALSLEVPLTRVDRSRPLRVGIRAGDILLASSSPQGLSARNVFPGTIIESREARRDGARRSRLRSGNRSTSHTGSMRGFEPCYRQERLAGGEDVLVPSDARQWLVDSR